MTQPEPTKPKRIDSLGRVTEPLAEHLWEKSWDKTSPAPEIDWDPKQSIIHASGGSKYSALFQSLRSQSFQVLLSENVTIIIPSDGKNGPYLLEKQLIENKIPFLNAKIELNSPHHPFLQKLFSLRYVLPQVKTKWLLSLDAFDVILQGSLDPFIQEAERRDLNAFFGAERGHWPPQSQTKAREISLHPDSPFQFLNAGVGLMKTEWLGRRTERLTKRIDDQEFFKDLYVREYPNMDIDHEAKFVLNLNGTIAEVKAYGYPATMESYLSKSKILIVGNGKSATKASTVEDLYDTIVRFNRFPTTSARTLVGKRTDIWACCVHTSGDMSFVWENIDYVKPKLILLLPHDMTNERTLHVFGKIRSHVSNIKVEVASKDIWEELSALMKTRPSSGVQLIHMCLRCGTKPDIVGFDQLTGSVDNFWGKKTPLDIDHCPKVESKWIQNIINQEKTPFIVVGFFTSNSGYERESRNLINSLNTLNIEYDISPIAHQGNWSLNACYKTEIIKRAMRKYPEKNILYVDIDAVFKKNPCLFNSCSYDLGVRYRGRELFAGTIFLANNEKVYKLVERWSKRNIEFPCRRCADQENLSDVISDSDDLQLQILNLPCSYAKIFDLDKSISCDPVIEHFQASRRFKSEADNTPLTQR